MALLIGQYPIQPRCAPELVVYVRAIVVRTGDDGADIVRLSRTAVICAKAIAHAHLLARSKEDI